MTDLRVRFGGQARAIRTTALAVLLLPITAAFAQDAPAAAPKAPDVKPTDQAQALKNIQKDIDEGRKTFFVPGASIAVIKDDKIILLTGLGYKDLKNKKPVTPDTLFAIGSTSKAFTSMIMAMAVDEGKVKFTDSPKKYLPYFRMQDPETDKKITINDLLSHRSGLPRTDTILAANTLSAEDMIWNITRAKPTAKLGEKWQYQNIMFVAAGEIEKKVYGNPWSELVHDRIFTPLGMKRSNTTVEETLKDADHSLGYDATPAMKELPMRSIETAAPAGAINSSAREMAEWIRFLLRKGEVNGTKLVSQENYDEIFKPHQAIGNGNSYGYGWMIRDWNGHKVFEHGGNIDGFNAQVAFMPDQNVGFVILTNVSGSGLPQSATTSVWKNLVGEPAGTDQIVAMVDPDKEVGSYHNDDIKMDVIVTHEGEKLFARPVGQPKMELLPLGARRYKVGPPAPDKVYVSFAPDKEDPKLTTVTLEQAGMKFLFTPAKPYQSPITAEELLDKETEAMGGAAKMAAIKTISFRYTYDMESQGVKEVGQVKKVAPNKEDSISILVTDSGQRFGWDNNSYDGVNGYDASSFGPKTAYEGQTLADIGIAAIMWQELNWRSIFTKVAVTGEEKVEGVDTYIVEKTPKVGSKVTDYISKSDYKLLKRVLLIGGVPITDIIKEYTEVNGVKVPSLIIRETLPGSRGTVTVTDIHVD